MTIKKKVYPTTDALALACAAVREAGFTANADAFYFDPTADDIKTKISTKLLLKGILYPDTVDPEIRCIVNVKQCDVDLALEIIKFYRRLSFGALANNISEYHQKVFQITQSDAISLSDLGVLASVPTAYQKDSRQAEIDSVIKTVLPEYIGKSGESVDLNVLLLEVRRVERFECWAYLGVTGTNYLVSFMSKHKFGDYKSVISIYAKVRDHTRHYKTKQHVTRLNYVKLHSSDAV